MTEADSATARGQSGMSAACATMAELVSASAKTPPAPKTLSELLHMPAHMELSQIELIYRAEGNANLVLALPQFKKVLRLPKMISSRLAQQQEQRQGQRASRQQAEPEAVQQQQGQEVEAEQGQPCQPSASVKTKASTEKAGDLTMPDFIAYIEIMRRLLGNEFVCEADIVAIPKEGDRFWINEHIRSARPIARLDKEFVGQFGMLLPDVTQLPSTFGDLLANLQADKKTGAATMLGDTYAIEIKPKQGWLLLPSDVSDLFDLMPPAGGRAAGAGVEGSQSASTKTDTALGGARGGEGGKESGQAIPATEVASPAKLTRPGCKCRFCSMQLLKLRNRKIKRLSAYCPMELFSGVPARMLNALDALFACPQNNLRVFQNGNLIYGDHVHSISCEELHTRIFQGEMMVLIKHLLVACLLREFSNPVHSHVAGETDASAVAGAAIGKSTLFAGCAQRKAEAAAKIVTANVPGTDAADTEVRTGMDDLVKAVAGQPQPPTAAAAAAAAVGEDATKINETMTPEHAKQRQSTMATASTMAWKRTTIGANTCDSGAKSTNIMMGARGETESESETETLATRAQINKAEIFRLPKNCVLQKILHLQLLTKRHFAYMWQTGEGNRTTASYNALRSLLADWDSDSSTKLGEDSVEGLAPEQAYLLGATALDCSIMLTFQEIQWQSHCRNQSALQPWHVHLEDFQREFLTKVTVLDLDPKPDSHFHKFIKQTHEIEKCYRALN